MLDCISDISAYKETFHFILEKFRRTNLGYDTFIKVIVMKKYLRLQEN